MNKSTYRSSKIFDLDLFGSSKERLLTFLTQHLQARRSLITIVTPNPEQVMLSRKDHTFLDHLQSAQLRIPDGVGLIAASHWLSWWGKAQPLAERITGLDVMAALIRLAAEEKRRVLIVGGTDLRPATSSIDTVPLDSVVSWTPAFADVTQPTAAEKQALEYIISSLKPEMVFFAFGAPHQEALMMEWRGLLEKNGCLVALVVGGAPDILYGSLSRAPQTIQQLGLEWLFRLFQQPWRWRRQVRLLEFIWLTLRAPMLQDRY